MQKKLIALALASAFAAPAFAATSNVDVGGYINMSFDYLDDDAADDGKLNVSSNASNIYFKGSEDLGGGLKAFWQIQTYFSAGATGNTDASFGGAADGVGSGNTFVGLESSWGKALLGKHESPYKLVGRKYDFFGNQVGDSRNLINNGNDIRPNNVIAYGTPNFSGFSGLIAYVTNASGTANTAAADPSAISAMASYDNGPLSIGLGYQNIEGLAGADDNEAWRLGASYKFGNFKVAGLYQQETSNTAYASAAAGLLNPAVAESDADVWGLGASYAMGAFTLKGQYYSRTVDDASDYCALPAQNCSGGESDMWALGVDYALSKRTTLYGTYASADNSNDRLGVTATPYGGGHGDNDATAAGGSPRGLSVGVIHTF